MPAFRARFSGTCGEQFDVIKPGDIVMKGSRGGWVHVNCTLTRPTYDMEQDDTPEGVEDVDRWRLNRDMLGLDFADRMERGF